MNSLTGYMGNVANFISGIAKDVGYVRKSKAPLFVPRELEHRILRHENFKVNEQNEVKNEFKEIHRKQLKVISIAVRLFGGCGVLCAFTKALNAILLPPMGLLGLIYTIALATIGKDLCTIGSKLSSMASDGTHFLDFKTFFTGEGAMKSQLLDGTLVMDHLV